MDDANGDKSSSISCSICLDLVIVSGDRSLAKLQCGHEFHLDCIGSAFNMKGTMQCPNCRKFEGGRWLYANGSARSLSGFGMDAWTFNEDPYELSYSEIPYGVHWCPFGGFTGVHSSFEEMEPPSTTHHNLPGNAIFSERLAASSLGHSHVAYVRPAPRVSLNSSGHTDDFSHRRNGQSGQNEIYNPRALPVQNQSWGRLSSPFPANRIHINVGDRASVAPTTLRSARVESDAMNRSRPLVHPFLYGNGVRSSFVSSIVHPGSNARSHASHHLQQPGNPTGMPRSIIPGVRRFNGPRGLPLIMPAIVDSDRHGGFYVFPPLASSGQNPLEAENTLQWERDYLSHFPVISFDRELGRRGSSQQASGGSDSSNRSESFWQRHWC